MTSVNTNAAAITALRTLQQTNASLDATQNRVSTGYKIGEAKDNAAYWSISTTLKSDNGALSTVKDALGLGAATVDVAYEALNSAKSVLDEIKNKLTAATQDGVDKTKIQSEISELQKQLKAISSSATISGENWLDVDSSLAGYAANKQVVSGYSRDASGAVTISTIAVDTSKLTLVNRASGKEGILDGGVDGMTSAMTGGLSGTAQTTAVATKGSSVNTLSAVTATSNAATADTYRVVYKVDGQTYTLDVAKATYTGYTTAAAIDGTGVTLAEQTDFLNEVLTSDATFLSRASVSAYTAPALTIESKSKGTTSTAELVSAAFITSGTATAVGTLTPSANNAGVNAKTTMTTTFATAGNLTLDDNDSLTFDVKIGTNDAQRVTVNKSLISSVLKSTDGKISSISDFKAVLTQALKVANLGDVVVSGTTAVVLTGKAEDISVANVTTSKGEDLTTFDMTNADKPRLSALIAAVNTASERITTAAATLGSVAKRIDLQKNFVDTLMDTIEVGVGNLIDADMSEESTKLQALQTKQQLGIQALSIANSSAQNVLRLFQ